MKVAILSDIHGNAAAFKSVIAAAKNENISKFLIAGDFVGYYYRAKEVIEDLSKLSHVSIKGNHEDLYLEWQCQLDKRPDILSKYGSSFSLYTELDLKPVLELPEQKCFTLDNHDVLLCHGAPWDQNVYIYPDEKEEMIDQIFSLGKSIVVLGHTHYPVTWQKEDRIIVNPGSVGQPRNYEPGAQWACWDTNTHQVELRNESYDIQSVIEDCQYYDPGNTFLQNVLIRGQQ